MTKFSEEDRVVFKDDAGRRHRGTVIRLIPDFHG